MGYSPQLNLDPVVINNTHVERVDQGGYGLEKSWKVGENQEGLFKALKVREKWTFC